MATPFHLATRQARLPSTTRIFLRPAPVAPAARRHQPAFALGQRFFTLPKQRPQTKTCVSCQRQTLPATRQYSSQSTPPPPRKDPNRVAFWPFILVIIAATGAWVLLVNKRKDMSKMAAQGNKQETPASSPTSRFSDSDVTVVFVLGGPGAGKGTQCARLVDRYGFTHLSAGDLLRAEQSRPGSEFGSLIDDCIKNGTIVPMHVTIKLLENAMEDAMRKTNTTKGRFLIDGFPRKMDQALRFEEDVCRAKMVLFYDCPEAVMESRLLERGKTSGRSDDNEASIRKRFKTFVETSMPVVDHFEKEGRVVKIDASPTPDAVFAMTTEKMVERLGKGF